MRCNKKGRRDPNPNGSSFCGPSAITVLTGRTYQRVEKDLLKEYNNQYRIKILGMEKETKIRSLRIPKMISYLRECRLHPVRIQQGEELFPEEHKDKKVKTAFQWTKATYGKRGSRWFLMVVGGNHSTNHYIVIKGNRKWCTFDPPEGVTLKKQWKRWKGTQVQKLWEIKR